MEVCSVCMKLPSKCTCEYVGELVDSDKEKIIPLNIDLEQFSKIISAAFNKSKVKPDAIKPNHYAVGGIEPIDYMKVKMSAEAFNGFLLGNVIKYTSRYEHKNGLEDLRKAQNYLDRLVKELETGS